MHLVFAYDVVSDSRRARLHKRLKRLLVPVQRSVFEGDAPHSAWGKLEALITRELNLEQDSVRIYPLCKACAGLVRSYGTAPELLDPDAPFIVEG